MSIMGLEPIQPEFWPEFWFMKTLMGNHATQNVCSSVMGSVSVRVNKPSVVLLQTNQTCGQLAQFLNKLTIPTNDI